MGSKINNLCHLFADIPKQNGFLTSYQEHDGKVSAEQEVDTLHEGHWGQIKGFHGIPSNSICSTLADHHLRF
ncbi:hypothetical protein CHS0354_012973 [Potamilus streckersoni]|uniref:Uncharacterized protein n=1 Tax=Potamilus streckersoni TaxID=2493646 RepID=A0AAE0T8J6_9BIVA|nr:hypothetical protein CHS0354_012973 [Potamilus streckersoni]